MKTKRWLGLLIFFLLFISACGDEGPTTPTAPAPPPPPPAPPPTAVVDVAIGEVLALVSGGGNLFFVEVTMSESGGVGCNINFARLEVFRATGEREEAAEIGADDIIEGAGDNRLEANATEDATMTFFFRSTVKKGRTLRLTMNFGDDNSHTIEAVEEWIFV